ncbi:MAG: caspase family protein [Saprospiraceae bacterium]
MKKNTLIQSVKALLLICLSIYSISSFAQKIESVTQTGHSFFFPQNLMIYDLKFTEDGKQLISAGQDGQAIMWDVATGRKVKSFSNQADKWELRGVDISKDGKKIVLGTPYSPVVVYDVEHERVLEKFVQRDKWGNIQDYTQSVIMGDDRIIAAPHGLSVFELGNKKPVKEKAWSGDNNDVVALSRSADRSMLAVSTGWKDKKLVLYSYPNLKKIKKIKLKDAAYTPAAISKKNRYVATGDGTGKQVYILDRESKYKVIQKVSLWRGTTDWDKYYVDGLAFSADEKYLFVAQSFLARAGSKMVFVQKIEVATGKIETVLDGKKIGSVDRLNRLAISPDGKILALGRQNLETPIQLYAVDGMKKIRDLRVYSLSNNALAVSKSGRYLVSAQGKNMVLWDLHRASPAPIYFAKDTYHDFEFSEDEKIIYAGTSSSIYKYYLDGRRGIKAKTNWANHIKLSPDEQKLMVMGAHKLSHFDTKDLKDKYITRNYNAVIGYSTDNHQAMSPNGKWEVFFGGKKVTVMDVMTGKVTFDKEYPSAITSWLDATAINDDATILVIGNKIVDATSGEIIKVLTQYPQRLIKGLEFSPDGKMLALGLNSGEFVLLETGTWKTLAKEKLQNIALRKIRFDLPRNRIFIGGFTGEISVFDFEKKQLVASFNGTSPEQYVMRTPQGYYHSSKGTLDIIHYRKDNKVFGFENFDLLFNRPDIVAKALLSEDEKLVESYQKAWLKRVEKMGFTPEQFKEKMNLPEVKITNNIPLTTSSKSIEIQLSASDSEFDLERINIYVNGVPFNGRKGFSIAKGKKEITKTIQIDLTSGLNKITTSVLNSNGIESLREEVNVTSTADFGKPDFYYVGVGVSKFIQADKNLTYADKDANDLAKFFKNKNAKYENQYVLTITNQQATTKNTVAEIKAFTKNARPQDVVIVTFSTHGGLDEKFDYFLCTHDTDFKKLTETGLAYSVIDELMDGVKSRQKVLMIDACHSGEIDKTGDLDVTDEDLLTANDLAENVKTKNFARPSGGQKQLGLQNSFYHMKNLFADLRRGSGTEIISAAAGVEYALESAGWANGIFTYSVLDGLMENKADSNKDKTITVSELQKHVYQTVVKMTAGKQHPVNRAQNLATDFSVW